MQISKWDSRTEVTNLEERGFSGRGDGVTPDAASLHISQFKGGKRGKELQE